MIIRVLAGSVRNHKKFQQMKAAAKHSKKFVAEHQGRIYRMTLRAPTPQGLRAWIRTSPWLHVINDYLSDGKDIGDSEMVLEETGRWWHAVHMDNVWKKPTPGPRQPGPRF